MTAETATNSSHHEVKLTTPSEIKRLSDAQSVARIDELRESATRSADGGDMQMAIAYWSSACEIAKSNYVCTDVLTEYADFLDQHDMPGYAGLYRDDHRELMRFLSEYGLPKPEYEHRLREENAKAAHEHGSDGTRSYSLAGAASEARMASHGPGAASPERSRDPLPQEGRGQGTGVGGIDPL